MRYCYCFVIFFFYSLDLFSQPDLSNGLIAYYPFNGNFKDESGNKLHPINANASLSKDRSGKPNSACSFNGKDQYIRIADHPLLRFNNSFSLSAWVMVNGFYDGKCHGNRIIMKGTSDYLKGNYFLTFDDTHSSNGNNCYTDKPDKKKQSFYAPSTSPTGNQYIETGKWYLLTYVYDVINARLYVNCSLYASGRQPGYRFSNSYDLFFGKMDNYQYPYWFNGLLDEVRIYNRALSMNDIRMLCNKNAESYPKMNPCKGINIPVAGFTYTINQCTNVAFKQATDDRNEIKRVKWFFGDGESSTERNPVHSYKRHGEYKVKLVVTNRLGCSDTSMRVIKLMGLKSDFFYSEKGEPGKVEFRAKSNKAAYNWNLGNGFMAENETVVTTEYTSTGTFTVQMAARSLTGCLDTATKNISIRLPDTIEKIIVGSAPGPLTPAEADPRIEERNNDLQQIIQVNQDSVFISLYDNGIIDGDTVTLVYNKQVIASRVPLGNKPVTFAIKIDRASSINQLIMFAENLGSIPPNTALMIIKNGEKSYRVNLSSSENVNAVVSFIPDIQ